MKSLRTSLKLLGASLLTLLALTGALWLWSGAGTSLATLVSQLQRYLPAGQTLEVKEIEGTLRGGGRIGWLRWHQDALSIEARDVRVAWTLRPLLNGELRLSQLTIGALRIEDQRASAAGPTTAPIDLRLPLRVDTPFSVAAVAWLGRPSLQLTAVSGHYAFDGDSHRLDAGQVQIASGNYRVKASLQALAPMALRLQVDGSVQTTLPSSTQPINVLAHAEVSGALAGRDATLALQARLQSDLAAKSDSPKSAGPAKAVMQAYVTAKLQPWQPQPVSQATAQWQALDLAALWPQAPQTQLSGQATVTPTGAGWRSELQLSNTQSGPWNLQRLPLVTLNASGVFVAGQWTIESLQARGAGGRLEGLGQYAASPNWQGKVTLHGINPAALDSRLASTALDGEIKARQTPSGITFDAQVQAAAQAAAVRRPSAANALALLGLRLKTVHAQGRWLAPVWQLDTLLVQTDDAQVQGQLTFDSVSHATSGQLDWTLPGASATLQGRAASASGQGELHLRVTDAARAAHWLQRWPGMAQALGSTSIQGQGEVTGKWQGGWQQQGQALHIEASLRVPKLELRAAGQSADQAWFGRDWQAELAGTLRAFSLRTRGQADYAKRRFALQAQAHAGRLHDGVWQAQIDAAQGSVQSTLEPGLWQLQLDQPVALGWTHSGGTRALDLASGSAHLSGPAAGTAALSWQAARWSQPTAQGPAQWHTKGSLQGLPLAWLELLGQTQLANLGLRGDLILGGQWEANVGQTLGLRATLERTSGDLQLALPDGNVGTLSAGVRAARLVISADGEQAAASLRWESERAGQIQADFGTRLQRVGAGWTWPTEAPLTGTLQAQLPPIAAWSLLAPPGWRLRGTLDASAVLSGTRGAPQWRGTLQAQDLALRSVVDGIDFSHGALRASLTGQRLDIDSFTLQGVGGNSGGLLSVTGSVAWLPAGEPGAALASRLRMALDAQARNLRVSASAERRLVLSGQLSARLDAARLVIRGALKADEALFILPDDTVPQLSDDVVLRTPASSQAQSRALTTPTATGGALRVSPDVAVSLDLGQNFQVRGRGLITRLAGQLELQNSAGGGLTPRLSGELHTVGGSYKAYGQQLDIEEGVLRFAGPFDNPALDILAIRPNMQQRVGVQISGTALSPLVRLYADPELSDAEKLAWLVLGHAGASGGAEMALLQQAALALLGGNAKNGAGGLAQALGIDELSLHGGASAADSGSSTGATITLGKRVSRDFYVAYERSLAGTLGTFSIFYDLSRRFTLRAQTGAQSAIDLIFTLRYD